MNESEIYAKLTEIARDIFDDEGLTLTADTTANEVENWDSMSHINFVVMIEGAFHVKFTAAEIEELKNIGDLVKSIQRHMAK